MWSSEVASAWIKGTMLGKCSTCHVCYDAIVDSGSPKASLLMRGFVVSENTGTGVVFGRRAQRVFWWH